MQRKNKILWAVIPIVTTANQICMQIVAHDSLGIPFGLRWMEIVFANPWLLFAIMFEIVSFLAWLKILATHNLSVAFPISSISYILILLAGKLIFHETISPVQIIGSCLIMTGCWLIGTAGRINPNP